MDIGDAENQLKKADSFLTTLEKLLKKHWKIIILLLLCGFVYWAFALPPAKPDNSGDQDNYTEDTTQY